MSSYPDCKSDPLAFLTSVGDLEYGIVESLLNAYDIPCVKKYKEAGGYLNVYMGSTKFGIDIFVPERLLQQAQELLNANMLTEDIASNEDVLSAEDLAEKEASADLTWNDEPDVVTAGRIIIGWALSVVFVFPLLVLLVLLFLYLTRIISF